MLQKIIEVMFLILTFFKRILWLSNFSGFIFSYISQNLQCLVEVKKHFPKDFLCNFFMLVNIVELYFHFLQSPTVLKPFRNFT